MLKLSNSLVQAICNQIPFAVGIIKVSEGELVYMNRAASQLFQCTVPVKLPTFLNQTLQLTDELVAELIASLDQQQEVKKTIQLFGQKDAWSELSLNMVEGEPDYALLQFSDMSGSVKTEETLLKEIQKFEALFNYASMGIVVADHSGTVTLSNPFANRQFGYGPGELIGQKIEVLIPMKYRHGHEKQREKFHSQPEARAMGVGLELYGVRKGGEEFPVQISLGHFESHDGRYAIAFIVDDTSRKAYELEIIRQKEEMANVNSKMKQLNELLEFKVAERTQMLQDTLKELENSRDNLSHALEKEKQLNDMKSRFVSMASHEFRTPLSTILSSITLLSKYITTEEQLKREKHIDRIKASVTNLTDILDEFLSLGRIEDGKIEPKWAEFSLPDLVSSVIRQIDPIRKPGQGIVHDHSGNDQIVLDPGLLKNVFMNLISNAIKFSPERSIITITSSVNRNDVEISIKDQGLGISKTDQQHLFERFFRGANVTNIQGTGLGLHIVSRYVQLMNGSITCKSEIEKGTEFIIRFRQHKFEG